MLQTYWPSYGKLGNEIDSENFLYLKVFSGFGSLHYLVNRFSRKLGRFSPSPIGKCELPDGIIRHPLYAHSMFYNL